MDEKLLFVLPFVLLIAVAFLSAPLRATMYIIAFQKIIDILWFVRPKVGGFDLTVPRLLYTILPVVLIFILLVEQQKRKLPRMPWLKNLIIFYLVWFAFSVWRGPNPAGGFELLLKVYAGFVMFGAGWYYFDSEEKFDEFARLHSLTSIIPFLGVALQFFGIFELSNIGVNLENFGVDLQTESSYLGGEMGARYTGFFNDPGSSSLYMLTAIPTCFYLYTKSDNPHKWVYLLVSFMGITTVILGFARGMWVMLGVVLSAWMWINNQYGWLAAGFIALSLWFVTSDFLGLFFSDIVSLVTTGKWGSVSGKSMRWEIMADAFEKRGLIDQLFGGGVGTASIDISKVTGLEGEGGESDIVAYKNDLGYLGWLMFLGIPAIALLMSYKRLRQVQRFHYCEDLLLKYNAFFAAGCVYLVTLQGSGSRWVSFTFPLWFMAGFILKPSAFWIIQRINQPSFDERFYINPQLNA